MMDYPCLGSLPGTGSSYCSWTPIRPVVVPFPMFQHWYLQAAGVPAKDCLLKPFDSSFACYTQLRLSPCSQSAFSPVSHFDSQMTDGSSIDSRADSSRRDSGMGDSFFSFNYRGEGSGGSGGGTAGLLSPSRSPENRHCRSFSEFSRSPELFEWEGGKPNVEADGCYTKKQEEGVAQMIGKNAPSSLIPLLPNGICMLPLPPLPPLVTLMGEARADSKSPGGESGRSSTSSSVVVSFKKSGRPPKPPKVDSPKKLRPLVCKGRTRPVSQVSPPGDENLDAADCQSPTAVLLSLVNTDLMHTAHTDFEPREESFRFEKSKENGFRFDKRDEIPVMASINCHSSSEFNIIPKKNSNAPRKKRPKRPLQSGSGISEGANNAPNKWRSYVCKICNRYFQYPRSLLTHQLVHQDVRPHKCTFPSCSKAFRQTGHLQTHLLIHTGDKPFRCPVQGCPTLPFRHANRRCPIHTDIRLKKILSQNDKPLDLSLHAPSSPPLMDLYPEADLLASGNAPESSGQEDMAQAAMALLQFAKSAVPSVDHPPVY